MTTTTKQARGGFLTCIAIGLALLAVSNASKALQYYFNPEIGGVVIFGLRAQSVSANLFFGPLMGGLMALYAYGVWNLRPWIKYASMVHAFYVPTNLIFFWFHETGPTQMPLHFLAAYLCVALPGSIGTALYVASHPEKLC